MNFGMYGTPLPTTPSMSDTHAMAVLRNELLNAMYHAFPSSLDRAALMDKCRTRFLTRDQAWFVDAVNEQLGILQHANLVRTAAGGFTVTERGRQDRQQAARFFNQPPKDAA